MADEFLRFWNQWQCDQIERGVAIQGFWGEAIGRKIGSPWYLFLIGPWYLRGGKGFSKADFKPRQEVAIRS